MRLEANNLTICIPSIKCDLDRHCHNYCIAHITGFMKSDWDQMLRNAEKVKTVARAAGVTSVLVTSKREPLYAPSLVATIGHRFQEWPLELQTAGEVFREDQLMAQMLRSHGYDTVALSVEDHPRMLDNYKGIIQEIRCHGMNVRLTVNVVWGFGENQPGIKPADLLAYCRTMEVEQLLIRKISAPDEFQRAYMAPEEISGQMRTINWIKGNKCALKYKAMVDVLKRILDRDLGIGEPRLVTQGLEIYDTYNMSVAFSQYCVQEQSKDNELRSLIFKEDGHLYPFWNSRVRFF